MVGDGQKQAVYSVLVAREAAERHGKAWQQIAETSARRHRDARASELEFKAAQVRTTLYSFASHAPQAL